MKKAELFAVILTMRKIAFLNIPDDILKLMIYDSPEGVLLLGYDCVQDSSAVWDNWYENLALAEAYCKDTYHINEEDWIPISDPCSDCQHGYISHVRVKGRNTGKPIFGTYEMFEEGQWKDYKKFKRLHSFNGLSGNERLYLSGLLRDFDLSTDYNKEKILIALKIDNASVQSVI